jgi:hypothetical protein
MDRALAREPERRYRNANEFGREVRGLTRSLTGSVDVEAGTQVVKAEDLKNAVPATRVDAAAAAAARAKQPAGAATAKVAVVKQGLPMIPIAAAVLVVVLGGATFALKDRLFGGNTADTTGLAVVPFDKPVSDTSSLNPGSGTVDSVKPETPKPVTPPPVRSGDPVKPPVTPGRRDSAFGPVGTVPASMSADSANRLLDYLTDQIIEVPAERAAARIRAEVVYRNAALPDTIRGKAAVTVAQAYAEEANLACAGSAMSKYTSDSTKTLEWARLAARLDSKKQENLNTFLKSKCQ